jgi:hypothetical protein
MANACKNGNDDDANNSNNNKGDDDENEPGVKGVNEWKQRLEVVSLVGTLSPSGKHLHISVSDEHGNVFGGHLLAGTVFTTLELVIGVIQNMSFSREIDPATGYKELVISKSTTKRSRENSG